MIWPDESPGFLPPEVEGEAASGQVSPLLVAKVAAHIWTARKAYLARLPVAGGRQPTHRSHHPVLREAMLRTGIQRLLLGCRKDAMLHLLQAELGDPEVLDVFRPRPGGHGSHPATGPAPTTHIFSGDVPGLPAISLIHGFLVKSANLGKPSSEEPGFPALFARSIAAVDPKLAAALAILPYAGGDIAVEAAAFAASEGVIAYGSHASIGNIRGRVPAGVGFVGQGHRISFAVVGRETLDPGSLLRLAERLAYDVSLFGEQGCVSPHLISVERGGAEGVEKQGGRGEWGNRRNGGGEAEEHDEWRCGPKVDPGGGRDPGRHRARMPPARSGGREGLDGVLEPADFGASQYLRGAGVRVVQGAGA